MTLFWCVVLGLAQAVEFKRPYRVDPAKVTVVDGDTIKHTARAYRLYGFDAPELFHSRCASEKLLGQKAKQRVSDLIHSGAKVQVKASRETDKYGRLLGVLLVGGQDVGTTLIHEGLAVPYFGKGPRKDWCATG